MNPASTLFEALLNWGAFDLVLGFEGAEVLFFFLPFLLMSYEYSIRKIENDDQMDGHANQQPNQWVIGGRVRVIICTGLKITLIKWKTIPLTLSDFPRDFWTLGKRPPRVFLIFKSVPLSLDLWFPQV